MFNVGHASTWESDMDYVGDICFITNYISDCQRDGMTYSEAVAHVQRCLPEITPAHVVGFVAGLVE